MPTAAGVEVKNPLKRVLVARGVEAKFYNLVFDPGGKVKLVQPKGMATRYRSVQGVECSEIALDSGV
jgi:hypothetical protein